MFNKGKKPPKNYMRKYCEFTCCDCVWWSFFKGESEGLCQLGSTPEESMNSQNYTQYDDTCVNFVPDDKTKMAIARAGRRLKKKKL